MSRDYPRDPDDLHGDAVVAYLEIKMRRNGAMSIGGNVNDEKYALAMLDTAKDTIKAHNRRGLGKDSLIVPAHDTALVTP